MQPRETTPTTGTLRPRETTPTTGTVGLIANPMSGRDVRRLQGRAPQLTPELKRNQIQRAVIGAAASGARRVLMLRDIFRSAEGAVENLRLQAEIEFLDLRIETNDGDTLRAGEALRKAGCSAVIVLGGDGTNRVLARAWPDAPVVPISTGTNNVFPRTIEATLAGAAAGLVASGAVSVDEVAQPCKRIEVTYADGRTDLALVDVALLEGDHPGSLLHFDPARLRHLVLTRAEPTAVGMSPIGGLLEPAGERDDWGVEVRCSAPEAGGEALLVPVSPGVYQYAYPTEWRSVPLGEALTITGPGVVAFDGDRQRQLEPDETVRLRIQRDGLRVIDERRTLELASRRGFYRTRTGWQDPTGGGGIACC